MSPLPSTFLVSIKTVRGVLVLVSIITKIKYAMNTISRQNTGKTSAKWKEKFLDVRKVKIIKFVNKKRLDASGLLDRIKTDGKICDAGCGDLSLLGQLKTLGYKNLYGFDIDEELINSSIKNSLSENEFSVIKVGSICQIPFDDESFNAVIIWGILHHIDPKDYKIALSEAARVLKPKGEIFIVEPYPYLIWKILSVTARFLGFFSIPQFSDIHGLLASEYKLLRNFSNNRKVIKNLISQQYHQVCSKWHTGFWIFGGVKQ